MTEITNKMRAEWHRQYADDLDQFGDDAYKQWAYQNKINDFWKRATEADDLDFNDGHFYARLRFKETKSDANSEAPTFQNGEEVIVSGVRGLYVGQHPQYEHRSVLVMPYGFAEFSNKAIEKKAKTRNINGFEVPAPVRSYDELDFDGKYYCAHMLNAEYLSGFVDVKFHSPNSAQEKSRIINCAVFKTKEDAEANAKALRGENPYD